MKPFPIRMVLPLVIAALAFNLTGCGKHTEPAAAAESAKPAGEEAAAPATETASTEESTTDTLVVQPVDVQATLGASDSAIKRKDWTGATDSLLKLQLSGSMRSVEDSWQYNKRMTALQNELIQAAESGDPKAKAAMELLRRSRRVP